MKNLFCSSRVFLLPVLTLLLLSSCEAFFGSKTPTDFLEAPQFDDRTVAYVPIQPVIDGLNNPVDVLAGWDELVYVADAGEEEIIAYDQAGNELGRLGIPGLEKIAQDRRLDILATGIKDTTINGTDFTLPAIYRINLKSSAGYGLNNATITKVLVHPFYFKSGTPTITDEAVRFTGIAPLADNLYYVSRTGPSNNPNRFGGPDNAVLRFSDEDELLTPVAVQTPLGLFSDYFKTPVAITSFVQPPQQPGITDVGHFLFGAADPNTVLKVQRIDRNVSENGVSYDVFQYNPATTEQADGFLYEPSRFTLPTDITVAGERGNYIFVVDAEKDSLYQFDRRGFEGVAPPAGSSSTKVILSSFGGTGIGLTQFNEPRGVAYLNQIVYVADAGNGRVLRFKLTTDFE